MTDTAATIDTPNDILNAYEDALRRHGYIEDPEQRRVLVRLEELQRELEDAARARSGLLASLRRRPTAVRGLYLWGGVGRGKTFLMDLFFDTLGLEAKRRVHFHRMMQDVHRRSRRHAETRDPLDRVAADIARETRVLCFDEFFVSDIGDAMILSRLLGGLFRRGVTLVATSNTPPEGLYPGGLQRERFLPAIALLEEHTEVVSLGGDVDYRLRLLRQAGTWLAPADAQAAKRLEALFDDAAMSQVRWHQPLEVNGREIVAYRSAKGIAWFEFGELCDGPRSQADYIEIARWYPTVILSGVPVLDARRENQARRFVALVDEFYDRNVKLIVSAGAEPASLYRGRRLAFEFERTLSRLSEMQSNEYLALPHRA